MEIGRSPRRLERPRAWRAEGLDAPEAGRLKAGTSRRQDGRGPGGLDGGKPRGRAIPGPGGQRAGVSRRREGLELGCPDGKLSRGQDGRRSEHLAIWRSGDRTPRIASGLATGRPRRPAIATVGRPRGGSPGRLDGGRPGGQGARPPGSARPAHSTQARRMIGTSAIHAGGVGPIRREPGQGIVSRRRRVVRPSLPGGGPSGMIPCLDRRRPPGDNRSSGPAWCRPAALTDDDHPGAPR